MDILREGATLSLISPTLFTAITYHRTHRNERIEFNHYQYLKELYCDSSDQIVVKKSVQNGCTEYLIIRSMCEAKQGRSIFYILPTFNLRNRFVNNRIDRSIQFSPYYQHLIKIANAGVSESVSLKHIGNGSIAFAGSNSAAEFTEYPADTLIIDELDKCDQQNLAMSKERLSNSQHKMSVKISNPTINDYGIDEEFKKSDKKAWFIKCEHCGEKINPDFFRNIVREISENEFILRDDDYEWDMKRDINMICDKCGKPMNRFIEGEWIPEQKSDISGYHINKLFSTTTKIKELVINFNEALTNNTKMERFYNADLGLAYTSSGAKISFEVLNRCKRDYSLMSSHAGPTIAGIDVGSTFHTVIADITPDNKARIVFIGELNSIEEVYDYIKLYNIRCGVIDGEPDTHLIKKLCYTVKGFIRCYYHKVVSDTINTDKRKIVVDRTEALDTVKEAFMLENILLPKNADKLQTLDNGFSMFYNHINNSTRIFNADKNNYEWQEGHSPDHYLHSVAYLLIAKRILSKI